MPPPCPRLAQSPSVLGAGHSGDLPPGEGMFWLGGAAFAEVARLGEHQSGFDSRDGWWHAGTSSDSWVASGGVACTRFAPGVTAGSGLRSDGWSDLVGRFLGWIAVGGGLDG